MKKAHNDNFSGYVQSLIERDLDGLPPTSEYNERILSDLARTYGGYFAPKLDRQLSDRHIDQPKALHTMLRWLSECLAAGYSMNELVVAPRRCTTFAPVGDEMRIPLPSQRPQPSYPEREHEELRAAEDPATPPEKHTMARAEQDEHRHAAGELRKALKPQTPPRQKQSARESAGEAKHG